MIHQNHNYLVLFLLLLVNISCVPMSIDESEKSDVKFKKLIERFADEQMIEAKSSTRFGDRYFLESVLLNAFGESIKTNDGDPLHNLIFKRQGVFGGGCDRYETNFEETGAGANNFRNPEKRQDCFSGNWDTSQIGKSTVIRSGYMVKFCELVIVNNQTAVDYAFNKAQIDPSETKIDSKSLNRLYHLFYPSRSIASGVELKLQKTINHPEFSNEENWKLYLLAICVSPGWQIP